MGDGDTGWRLRPAILAGMGAVAGLLVQQLAIPERYGPVAEWRTSLAIGIGIAALAIGLALERVRLAWTLGFALAAGLIAGLVTFWSGSAGDDWLFQWPYLSLAIALGVALPLFQVARDEGAARWPYAAVHGHAWTNALLWLAAWVFTGVVFALAWLLAALFGLIGLTFLRDLLGENWFWATLVGAAFGAALGLLRERERVVRLLQAVTLAVLGVLAPVLAVGLVVFLLALPFTGLDVLWETRAATATLLSAAAGALLLANAVIGDGPADESRNLALRWGAMALAACVLPLAVLAAVATGLRLQQYGPTPERLWALVSVALGCAYGLVYLVALVRGRQGWAEPVRAGNLRLAFGVAAIALLLATPLVSFDAIATSAQVARLKDGRATPDTFDWAALHYDFGAPGKTAVAELRRSADVRVAAKARAVASSEHRYDVAEETRVAVAAKTLASRLTILPRPVPLPPGLTATLAAGRSCDQGDATGCVLFYQAGAQEAFSLEEECLEPLSPNGSNRYVAWMTCSIARLVPDDPGDPNTAREVTVPGAWRVEHVGGLGSTDDLRGKAEREAVRSRRLEIRTVQRRQVVIGGVPVGEAFE